MLAAKPDDDQGAAPKDAQGVAVIEGLFPDETAVRRLAAAIAAIVGPGDVVALSGDLGSGKTTFAREMVRRLADDPALEVPSPTFMLVQSFDLPKFPVVHADLYRIGGESELRELGLPDLFEGAVALVEWPERAGGVLPAPSIAIELSAASDQAPEPRRIRLTLKRPVPKALERLFAFYRFLYEAGYERAERIPIQGDASTRIYERLRLGERSAVLMIAPRRPDGPAVRDGKPYSAIAHLAEDVTPFVAMARALRERGFSAPAVLAADLGEGLLVLEDFGADTVVKGEPPRLVEDRYRAAVDMLAALHALDLPDRLPVAPSVAYTLPRYDLGALLIEAELLLDWYFPQQDREATPELREAFRALWREILAPVAVAPATWVLRDFHSPNLLWLPERSGVARLGLLDFQDAVMGPAAYDVVSLLQDARVEVPVVFEDDLMNRYMKARRLADRHFDMVQFVALYAILGAQRATKILGIFARLSRRDGKPQYIRHQPRVWRSLRRALAHPALGKVKAWYDLNVPAPRPG